MARNNSRHLGLGIILILVGVIFLLRNLDIVRIYNWWPIILLLIGVAFFVGWMRDRQQSGMLLPAGIFLVLGVQFLFLHASWPIYLLAPAAGFWLMYFLGERDVGLLVPASVLTVIALVFWLEDSFLAEWWPALLIILGVILLIFPRRAPKVEPSGNQSVHEQKGETEL